MRRAGTTAVGLGLAAVLTLGAGAACGSRVDVGETSSRPSTAAPGAPRTTATSGASTSAPTTTSAPEPTSTAVPTTAAPPSFCDAVAAAGLDDLDGFQIYDEAAARAKRAQLDAMTAAAPADMADEVADARSAIDEFLDLVESGEIVDKAGFDAWVVSLVGARMVTYVEGNQAVLAWSATNC